MPAKALHQPLNTALTKEELRGRIPKREGFRTAQTATPGLEYRSTKMRLTKQVKQAVTRRKQRASIAPRIGPTSTALANTSSERQPRAIGSGGHTPPPHQTRLLREPSPPGSPPTDGRLFSGRGSRLDAFSGYPLRRSCPACPAGQPVDQRPRRPVPFVLGAPSPQAAHTPRG